MNKFLLMLLLFCGCVSAKYDPKLVLINVEYDKKPAVRFLHYQNGVLIQSYLIKNEDIYIYTKEFEKITEELKKIEAM